jgi:hypothetical protein
MKNFRFSPLITTVAAAVILAGCAATGSNPNEPGNMAMGMCTPDANKSGMSGCPCCNMEKDGMSADMKGHHMGMMQGTMPSQSAGMCMPDKGGKDKAGCAGCGMSDGGCPCCGGMDKKEMSPEMHKKHMEMMRQHHPQMMQDPMPSKPTGQ